MCVMVHFHVEVGAVFTLEEGIRQSFGKAFGRAVVRSLVTHGAKLRGLSVRSQIFFLGSGAGTEELIYVAA